MKQNEQLLKENHQLNYKVNQFEEDYEELKIKHSETELELAYYKENYK